MSVLRVLLLGAGICLFWLFWLCSPEPRKDTTSATEVSQPTMTPVSTPSPQLPLPPPSTKDRADVDATSTTVPVPVPADFVRLDGDELILALDAMGQLNDAGRIDFFARQLRAEPRSDVSLQAEQQLTELLQNKVQIFRQLRTQPHRLR